MNMTPFIDAGLTIQVHMIFALPAVVIGPFVLFRARRDIWHKRLGYLWMVSMVGLAISGFFIPSTMAIVGGLGPLHFFSVLTLYSVVMGVVHARRGNIAAHRATLRGLWFGGIGAAGLMQFLPGRTVNQMVFGGPSDAGLVVIAVGAAGLGYLIWRQWDDARAIDGQSA